MLRLSKILRSAAVAGVVGLGLVAVAQPASARTYVRCDYDGDRCVRVHCDWDGDDCWRESAYYNEPYYRGSGRWVCDEDGDDCRWSYSNYHNRPYSYGYYHRPYYGPRV